MWKQVISRICNVNYRYNMNIEHPSCSYSTIFRFMEQTCAEFIYRFASYHLFLVLTVRLVNFIQNLFRLFLRLFDLLAIVNKERKVNETHCLKRHCAYGRWHVSVKDNLFKETEAERLSVECGKNENISLMNVAILGLYWDTKNDYEMVTEVLFNLKLKTS